MVRRPDFMIIGAQKCGTSWIHGCLRRHPGVYMANPGVWLEKERCDQSHIDEFLASAQAAELSQRIGYSRVCMDVEWVPERVHRAAPNVQIVVSLRDPISRAVSSWYQGMTAGIIPIQHVEQGLLGLLDEDFDPRWPHARRVLEAGLYHRHLQRWLRHFDKGQCLVLLAEELRRRPSESMQKLCRFVGIDETKLTTKSSNRGNPGVYSLAHQRYMRATMSLYRHGQSERDPNAPIRSTRARIARRIFKSLISDRILYPILKESAPELSSQLQSRLAHYYREDLDQLKLLLNNDLSDWPTVRLARESVSHKCAPGSSSE